MRKLALMVALASTAIATPAVARDKTGYIGVEGGGMVLEDMHLRATSGSNFYPEAGIVDFHNGVDVDLIAGYDFGAVRLEGELGYKRASVDAAQVDPGFSGLGPTLFDADGRARSLSGMVNGLVDFGDKDDGGWSGYVGAGIGLADVGVRANAAGTRLGFSDSDTKLAYQFLAGVRTALSDNVDLGLKYRHFRTKTLDFETNGILYQGKWRSHSLLASLIFNFAAPPPPPVVCPDGTELPAGSTCPVPPPPPPPPPQTQTCPDGSVILATETCPPPPPPPPPPAEPERG